MGDGGALFEVRMPLVRIPVGYEGCHRIWGVRIVSLHLIVCTINQWCFLKVVEGEGNLSIEPTTISAEKDIYTI